MITTYTVLLADGTKGTVSDDTLDGQHPSAFIGEEFSVLSHYENGMPIEVSGKLVEVLE